MTKDEFVTAYVANFLAAYAASKFEQVRMHDPAQMMQPIEPALMLAERAYERIKELRPDADL